MADKRERDWINAVSTLGVTGLPGWILLRIESRKCSSLFRFRNTKLKALFFLASVI